MGEINLTFVHAKPGLIKAFFKMLSANNAQNVLIAEIINENPYASNHWASTKRIEKPAWKIKTKREFFRGEYTITTAKALVAEYCFSIMFENVGIGQIITEL